MNQIEKAEIFEKLHAPGNPLVLYNVWDAGSAQAVEQAGALAIATGSWSVAASQGYSDGESIPLDMVEKVTKRICSSTELPVSIDFEGGYSKVPADVAAHVLRIIAAGAVGINFEDQVIGGTGLYHIETQCDRIAAIRTATDELQSAFFINARTDLFLQASTSQSHADLLEEAISRAALYEKAGASGIFVPGLIDESLISEFCQATTLPVNIMIKDGAPTPSRLAKLGVARISYGPGPYLAAMKQLKNSAVTGYQ